MKGERQITWRVAQALFHASDKYYEEVQFILGSKAILRHYHTNVFLKKVSFKKKLLEPRTNWTTTYVTVCQYDILAIIQRNILVLQKKCYYWSIQILETIKWQSKLDSSTLKSEIYIISEIQLVVYYQCCVLIGWATIRLLAH